MASCESTGRELSFEWSHHRISSTDSKVRVTLQNCIKHSGSERVNYETTKKTTQTFLIPVCSFATRNFFSLDNQLSIFY